MQTGFVSPLRLPVLKLPKSCAPQKLDRAWISSVKWVPAGAGIRDEAHRERLCRRSPHSWATDAGGIGEAWAYPVVVAVLGQATNVVALCCSVRSTRREFVADAVHRGESHDRRIHASQFRSVARRSHWLSETEEVLSGFLDRDLSDFRRATQKRSSRGRE